MQTDPVIDESAKNSRRHPILKKFGILILILFALTYFSSLTGRYVTEKKAKEAIIDTHRSLTGQDMTIDDLAISPSKGIVEITRLVLYNPNGYISPYAFFASEVNIRVNLNFNQVIDLDSMTELMMNDIKVNFSAVNFNKLAASGSQAKPVITEMRFKGVTINYDINSSNNVNLYQILNTTIKFLSPKRKFSLLELFDDQVSPTLRYNGTKFNIFKSVIEKPTINIYSNRQLLKTIAIDDIILDYNDMKLPASYAHILLASAYKITDNVTQSIRK